MKRKRQSRFSVYARSSTASYLFLWLIWNQLLLSIRAGKPIKAMQTTRVLILMVFPQMSYLRTKRPMICTMKGRNMRIN
uniref:Uncharacterized protein n=1 Tax=Arundo donax TaxID=35708 RepID=A0A0A9DVH9_ARUDO